MNAPQPRHRGDPFVDAAVSGDPERLAEWLARADLEAGQVRRAFATISLTVGAQALASLGAEKAAAIALLLPPEQAAAVMARSEPGFAAALLAELPSDERADLFAAVEPGARERITAALPGPLRAELARLIRYPPDTAGGLMETEVIAHVAGATVGEVVTDLRVNQQRYAALGVQYLYIVDESRRLAGVAALRDLLLAPEGALLGTLARPEALSVPDTASTQELADLFDTHAYQGLPVVDASGVLLGVVNRNDVTESEQHQSEEQYRRSQGIVGGEELRSMPMTVRARRRGAWLGVNLVLCLGGAGVIAAFQDTLASAIVVAAVLPVISATCGNAAMQAAAVSVRELSLGVVDPGAWRRVATQELRLAALLAIPLGVAVAGLAALWGAGAVIGAAVGVAMTLNAAFAVVVGAVCPLLLQRMKVDPALASGPVTTTLADMSGFALTLTLVAWAA